MMHACHMGVSHCTFACAAKTDATRSFVNCVLSPFTACRSDIVSRHGKIVHCEGTGLQNDGTESSLTDTLCPTPRHHLHLVRKRHLIVHCSGCHSCSRCSRWVRKLLSSLMLVFAVYMQLDDQAYHLAAL